MNKKTTIVIFGATGDLTKRKLIPALFHLYRKNNLQHDTPIVCISRSSMSNQEFISRLQIDQYIPKADTELIKEFKKLIRYQALDFSKDINTKETVNCSQCEKLSKMIDPGKKNEREIVFYLATPPSTFENISKIIKKSVTKDSTAKMRIAFEKPFGFSLASSRELNDSIAKIFSEDQIYRVDHYLGKALVQDILLFRFSNLLYEQIWSNKFVDHIQITIAESLGVEYRAGYYDKSGAIKDMFQNHLMQLLSLIAMEEPKSFDAQDVREQMANVISTLKDPKKEDLVIAQYDKYTQEKDVPADSRTETFIAVKTQFENERWQGVPIYLKTGKKLINTFAEINIVLKDITCKLFLKDLCNTKSPNIITIRIQPDTGISLSFNIKRPGASLEVMPAKMDFCHSCLANINTPEAYENVFNSIIDGDQTIFTSWTSIENSWKYTDKLLQLAKQTELADYPADSSGPAEADQLLKKDRREWIK